MLRASPLAVPLALLLRTAAVAGCSDWIMDDEYGLSVRTMDLGTGPVFSLKTQPKGTKPLSGSLPSSKYGHIISVGVNVTGPTFSHMDGDLAWAGLNEAGLSCDLHVLLNSSYPAPSHTPKDLNLFYLCNWALSSFASAAEVKTALQKEVVHLWGPAGAGKTGVHFMLRDRYGLGLAVEFMGGETKLYDDRNDGVTGYGVFTNEPEFPWQLANVQHFLWKQSLARPAVSMPGTWYPDERFLRIYLVKSGMPTPKSYQEAVQHALHVLNTITVPMGMQIGTDSGLGEGHADHTHYGHIYDHKNGVLYWRHESNLQLERVRLADVLSSQTPLTLPMFNKLPFFNDAAHAFS